MQNCFLTRLKYKITSYGDISNEKQEIRIFHGDFDEYKEKLKKYAKEFIHSNCFDNIEDLEYKIEKDIDELKENKVEPRSLIA